MYSRYKLYCENGIGKKRTRDIRKTDIDKLITQMQTSGHSKQTKNGCSVATIKKVVVQSLKPILQYAVDNNVIEKVPPIDLPKVKQKTKKTVQNAKEKLTTLFTTITSLYENDLFYISLFLFALYGRRWNEINDTKKGLVFKSQLLEMNYTLLKNNY